MTRFSSSKIAIVQGLLSSKSPEEKMSLKLEIQKQNYEEIVTKYIEVQKIALDLLQTELAKEKIAVMQLPSRIKSWESVEDKLIKKPDRYGKVEELSDILGIRVICYFLSQVDDAAEIVKRIFDAINTKYIEPMLVANNDKMKNCLKIIQDAFSNVQNILVQKIKVLDALNPERVLSQGYAILSGKISPGEDIDIMTARQEIKATIKDIKERK